MSFTTPTVDVYLPGTTLGIGNVNAGTINIGKTTTQINVGGPTTFTNGVATPSCTMASLTTGNLIISPYSENVRFSNLSATNATVTNMSATNASFQRFNSSNILIGPYPQNGTFDTINVTNPTITNLNSTNLNSTNLYSTNASLNVLNVSNFLITPLNSNPTFATITVPHIDVVPNTTLHLGNQNATAVYIGSSGTRNVINNIGTGSGTGTIYIGNNTNSIQLNGSISIGTGKNITLQPATGYIAPSADTMLGGITDGTFNTLTFPLTSSSTSIASINLVKATYMVSLQFQIDTTVEPSAAWANFGGTMLPLPDHYRYGMQKLINGQNYTIAGSFPISVTTAGTLTIILNLTGTVTSINVKKYQAVRIA